MLLLIKISSIGMTKKIEKFLNYGSLNFSRIVQRADNINNTIQMTDTFCRLTTGISKNVKLAAYILLIIKTVVRLSIKVTYLSYRPNVKYY